jgi:pseudouridine-5'-monophosphatase
LNGFNLRLLSFSFPFSTSHIGCLVILEANTKSVQWAQLPITAEEYTAEQNDLHTKYFPTTAPLPGVETLFQQLSIARTAQESHPVAIALATSSHLPKFRLKTSHLEPLFSIFPPEQRILGDDPRIPSGRGKPAPDIYLLALSAINESLHSSIPPIQPHECLVFEDAVPGVEAGRRAGMQVVWVPASGLAELYQGREHEVLAGKTGEGDDLLGPNELGSVGDGWAVHMNSLAEFDWGRWGVDLAKKET